MRMGRGWKWGWLVLVGLWAGGATGEEASAVRVAILPVVVHSAAPNPEYVSRGIADMLSSRLEQDGRARALRVDAADLATTEVSVALAAGRERRADYVLFGAYTQFGDGASLDLHCIPVARDEAEAAAARRIFIQSGAVGEIIPKLDEIVNRIAIYVSGGAAVASGGEPGAATPSPNLVRELAERVRALEARVYSGGEAEAAEASPGS